jgi:hypothetical protein
MTLQRLDGNALPQTAYFQFETTRDPETGMSPISRWMGWYFDYEDQTASQVQIHIPPGAIVLRVVHQVVTAWTGVTDIQVGDGTDPDGWIQTGNITPGTGGDTILDYDSPYAITSVFYADGDTIDVNFTGIATAGASKVFIEVISYSEALAST